MGVSQYKIEADSECEIDRILDEMGIFSSGIVHENAKPN